MSEVAAFPEGEPLTRPTAAAARSWAVAGVLVVVVFAAVAPTLTWVEFSSGSETLNVATALEMRRGGPWLVPTLKGYPRVTKPPLTAWVTAGLVRQSTADALTTPDPAARDAAYRRLAWEVRWPALVAGCAMLLAVYDLGRTLAGPRVALLAVAVGGTNLLFLRYFRIATTDVQLALWVTIASAFLARAVFRDQRWVGCVGGGLAIGLALMSKGPVALVQSALPMTVAALVVWRDRRAAKSTGPAAGRGAVAGPVIAAVVAAVAVGLPWYAHVLATTPDIAGSWVREVTREGATNLEPDPWYGYWFFPGLLLPWLGFFVAGVIMCARRRPWNTAETGGRGPLAALLLVGVPVVVMSFFNDKPDRYLLPLTGPAAIVTAVALRQQFVARGAQNEPDRVLRYAQWATIAVLVVGLPVLAAAGIPGLRDTTGGPWFGPREAAAGAAVGVAGMAVGAAVMWRRSAVVGATVAGMLALNVVFVRGYARGFAGKSEMKPVADAIWRRHSDQNVTVAYLRSGKSQPVDAAIYLNRTLREVDDLSQLTNEPRPAVAIAYQRGSDPPPTWPTGWTPYQTVVWENGKRTWHVAEHPRAGANARPGEDE